MSALAVSGAFVVSISPDNGPSLRLIERPGFVKVGEAVDEADGIEHVFVRTVDASTSPSSRGSAVHVVAGGGLMMQYLLYPLAMLAGLMNPLQAGCVGTVGKVLGRPLMAGVISVCGTALVTVVGSLLLGQFGFGGKAGQVPWWAWLGGIAGSVFLISQPVAAQKIGAGPFIGLTVTASVVASIVIDNYALLGFQQHAASVWRLLGAAMMIAGVTLVAVL